MITELGLPPTVRIGRTAFSSQIYRDSGNGMAMLWDPAGSSNSALRVMSEWDQSQQLDEFRTYPYSGEITNRQSAAGHVEYDMDIPVKLAKPQWKACVATQKTL